MAKNTNEIPYTEIQERVLEIVRVPENAKNKVRGTVQDIYGREIHAKFDWDFLFTTSSIITEKSHNDGTLSINTGDTTLSFSDANLTETMSHGKIKISNNPVVYDYTFVNNTTGTISPEFQGPSNASGSSYDIFKSRYPLSASFDRFPKTFGDRGEGGGLYKWEGGQKKGIPKESYIDFTENFDSTPGNPETFRFVEPDTAGCEQIELSPPPRDRRIYGYDYIKTLDPLNETSAGLVTINANSAQVNGTTECRFSKANTGDFLRIDAFGTSQDSEWHRILSIQNDSQLTLKTAFGTSGVTSENYVIASPPHIPVKLHPAILFGSVRAMTLDQTDDSFVAYHSKYAEVLSDAKRIFHTRIYSQKVKHLASEEFLYRR